VYLPHGSLGRHHSYREEVKTKTKKPMVAKDGNIVRYKRHKTHEMMITSVELEAGQDVVVDGISQVIKQVLIRSHTGH
jgi:hypothetical protein